MKSIQNQICEVVQVLSESAIKKAKLDTFIVASVEGYVDQTKKVLVQHQTGYYRLNYQDTVFDCYSSHPLLTYTIGQDVLVYVQEGNMTLNKLILGLVR